MELSTHGKVVSLHLNVGHQQPLEAVGQATFLKSEGIAGDIHCTTRIERRGRQVLLIEKETLEAFELKPGMVRENVTTQGIDLTSLEVGQRLALGKEVVLQISMACTPCSMLEAVRPGLQEQLRGRRGMLSYVEEGGSISIGDTVGIN